MGYCLGGAAGIVEEHAAGLLEARLDQRGAAGALQGGSGEADPRCGVGCPPAARALHPGQLDGRGAAVGSSRRWAAASAARCSAMAPAASPARSAASRAGVRASARSGRCGMARRAGGDRRGGLARRRIVAEQQACLGGREVGAGRLDLGGLRGGGRRTRASARWRWRTRRAPAGWRWRAGRRRLPRDRSARSSPPPRRGRRGGRPGRSCAGRRDRSTAHGERWRPRRRRAASMTSRRRRRRSRSPCDRLPRSPRGSRCRPAGRGGRHGGRRSRSAPCGRPPRRRDRRRRWRTCGCRHRPPRLQLPAGRQPPPPPRPLGGGAASRAPARTRGHSPRGSGRRARRAGAQDHRARQLGTRWLTAAVPPGRWMAWTRPTEAGKSSAGRNGCTPYRPS